MAISSATNKAGPYAGNGAQTAFFFAFYTLAAADIKVVSTAVVNGVSTDTVLTQGADYSVSLNADQVASPGGSVTMTVAPATGANITVLRNITAVQGASFPNQGGFYPKVLENALDKLTLLVQQLLEESGRALKLSVADSITGLQDLLTRINNAVATAVNAPGTQGTSTTSLTIGLGSQSLTIQTGKSIAAGMWLLISNSAAPTNWMAGVVTSYNSNTGALTVNVQAIGGSGTAATWNVSLTAPGGATLGRNTFTDAQNNAPDVTLASAATVNIGAATSNNIIVTGTTTITAFDTVAAGATRRVKFTGALTLTNNATSLILPGAANISTASGDVAQFTSLGSGNWICDWYTKASGTALPYLHVREEQPYATAGGGAVAGMQTRVLNTVVTNTITGASLASNVITLPAGTYRIVASAPVSNVVNGHKAYLYNVTDAAIILTGTSEYAGVAAIGNKSFVNGRFTLGAQKNVRLDHWIQTAKAADGLGQNANANTNSIEVFSVVEIWKES